jgi:hypothetical protein
LDQTNQNHHDSDDEKNMDESSHRSTRDEPEEPENNQDDSDEIKHRNSSACGFLNIVASGFDIASSSTDGVAASSKKC